MTPRKPDFFGFHLSSEGAGADWKKLEADLPVKGPQCPPTAVFLELALGRADTPAEKDLRSHLAVCDYCRDRFARQERAVQRSLAGPVLVPAPTRGAEVTAEPAPLPPGRRGLVETFQGQAAAAGGPVPVKHVATLTALAGQAGLPVHVILEWSRAGAGPWRVALRLPSERHDRKFGNAEAELGRLDGCQVRLQLLAAEPAPPWTVDTQLYWDPEHTELVSHPEGVALRDPTAIAGVELVPLRRIEGLGRLMTGPTSNHAAPRTIIAFPAIGSPVPDCRLADGELGASLRQARPPHWLYHLEVFAPGRPALRQRFTPARPEWLRQLAGYLGLSPAAYEVAPLELFPSRRQATDCSDVAFPIPLEFEGTSWSMAVAVGLAAAATARPLPAWVVCSGCLPRFLDAYLRLEPAGQVEDKIELCLGRSPEYDVSYLVNRFYQHPATDHTHGPRPLRAVSGKVKLLLLPRVLRTAGGHQVDGLPADLMQRLGVEPVPAGLADFRHADLGRTVEDLRQGGLLVVQAPTVWHALAVLGFGEDPSRLGATVREHLAAGECFVFRVPSERRPLPLTTRDYQERKTSESLRELDAKLRDVPGSYARLQIILRQCVEQLGGSSGHVSRVGADPKWLEVVACWGGSEIRDLPLSVPAEQGIRGRALRTKQTQVATTQRQFQDLLTDDPADDLLQARYPEEECRRYQQLVERIAACLVVPLKQGNEVIGVLCIHRLTEGSFDAVEQHVVEKLAERAAIEVARQVANEKAHRQRNLAGRARDLARRVADMPLAAACGRLSQELAELALEASGGFRTAVRLLSHDRESLSGVGMAGGEDVWPPACRQRIFTRAEPAACNRALDGNAHWLVREKRQGRRCEDLHPDAAAHLALVLRSGLEPIGVLSVDFAADRRIACNEETEKALEELAAVYVGHIHAFSTDQLCTRLDATLLPLGDGDPSPDKLKGFLDVTGQALGVESGSLFLRNPDTGQYDYLPLATTQVRPEWPMEENCSYAPGEGRTGWVILHKRPLRIADCEDERALRKIRPRLRPTNKPRCWDRTRERLAYLAVPILVGDDVLGVLRFVCKTPKPIPGQAVRDAGKKSFTSFDQHLAQAAAARLSTWLYKVQERKHRQALDELRCEIIKANARDKLARAVFQAVRKGVGDCCCLVRVVDRCDDGTGQPHEVLDRLFLSEPRQHGLWPQFRFKGITVSGRVWRDQKTAVITNTRTTPLRGRVRKELGREEPWWDQVGTAVVAPMVVGDDLVGTLAAVRKAPDILLQADVEFVERVAGLASLAFTTLAETEERRIQEGLLWAVVTYLHERQDAAAPRQAQLRLLARICEVLTLGLDREAAVGYFWVCNETTGLFQDTWSATDDLPSLQPVAQEAVARAMGESRFVVVSDPATDRRLAFLLEALPRQDRERYQGCQQAAVWLPRTEHLRQLAPPALFFFAVEPPQRLSYTRVELFVRMLMTTVLCPTERGAAQRGSARARPSCPTEAGS
jgi:GAF domain-containing protein